jgi:hypothetical protein
MRQLNHAVKYQINQTVTMQKSNDPVMGRSTAVEAAEVGKSRARVGATCSASLHPELNSIDHSSWIVDPDLRRTCFR